ncbi:hypothetical protein GGE07_002487 [Sinorhizobium terangae]|nr:hypothetical protein [Sinorhizobium terangae]
MRNKRSRFQIKVHIIADSEFIMNLIDLIQTWLAHWP